MCMHVCLCPGVSVPWCVCTLVCLYPGVSVPWCVCTLVCLYPGVSVPWCVCTPVCLYPSVSVPRCVCTPVCLPPPPPLQYMILIAVASVLQVAGGGLAVNQDANVSETTCSTPDRQSPPLMYPSPPLLTQLRGTVASELTASMASFQPHTDFQTAYNSLHQRVG